MDNRASVKIKRLFITDPDDPSARRGMYWEDEYGTWAIGDTNSPNAFALGFVPPPSSDTLEPHPELQTRTLFSDYLTKGENGQSYEVQAIMDPVIIEAMRRWNAGMYDAITEGDVELPTPGNWECTMTSQKRISDKAS